MNTLSTYYIIMNVSGRAHGQTLLWVANAQR